MTEIQSLYRLTTGSDPVSVVKLAGGGSTRSYYRITGTVDCIGVEGVNERENNAFIYLDRHFSSLGLPVPRLIAVSDDGMTYLLEDCGDTLLFEVLDREECIEEALTLLSEFQFRGGRDIDYSNCFPVPAMDERAIKWDLDYFKYCFLKTTPVEFDELTLDDEFTKLSRQLAVKDGVNTFMYRDFQSRNVMVKPDGHVVFIDFQGGRRGPVHYDVASFLWQARAGFSPEQRERYIECYLKGASRFADFDPAEFRKELKFYVLLRQLQVLGAYGYRGLVMHKAHFVKSIPPAVRNLRELVGDGIEGYPYLSRILAEMCGTFPEEQVADNGRLTVKVASFSYKKGIPVDMSGNGGGFVFDCRGLHNPGRYEEYKQLTGRDRPVAEFLEKEEDVRRFVADAESMVGISVETYIRRGFSSLMVSFGCTGGQHRSVYCAERMARYLRDNFNCNLSLCHREQGITEFFVAE